MKSKIKLIGIATICFPVFFLSNCNSGDDSDMNPGEINIEEAKLSDFPLFGIERTAIDIVDPEIVDNKEM